MSGTTTKLIAAVAVLAATACSDLTSSSEGSIELSPAFQTIPVGFSANSNSFAQTADAGVPFYPESMARVGFHGGNRAPGSGDDNRGHGKPGQGDHHDGFGHGGIRGLLMGGGLGPDFIGAIAFGKGKGRGPFGVFKLPESCTFDATSGRVTCPETEHHGLTVNISFAFKNAAGTTQPAFDTASTDLVNVKTEVSGTRSRHDDQVTSTVSHKSDRTVEGLAPGSTSRKINGTAEATENTTGTRDEVEFTANRVAYDTTSNLVVPIVDGRPTIPSSGVVIRRMTVTITKDGGTPTTRFRREQVTFDGTNVIKVVITQDETTKNCTLTLPAKKLVCEE